MRCFRGHVGGHRNSGSSSPSNRRPVTIEGKSGHLTALLTAIVLASCIAAGSAFVSPIGCSLGCSHFLSSAVKPLAAPISSNGRSVATTRSFGNGTGQKEGRLSIFSRSRTTTAEATTSMMTAKPSRVFVAGATGRLGQRVVRELLLDGVGVAAGVRPSSLQKAEDIFSDEAFMPKGLLGNLDILGVDLESVDDLCKAMQASEAVVCALGAAESEPFNVKGPYQVDGVLSQKVITAAKETSSVKHFVLVTALGTGKFGLPASALNLFWGILSWKKKTEQALLDSGLPYTILRPGGMERPQDDFEDTHNVRVASKDTLFGGAVSRLQVAKLAVAAVASPDDSTNKVLEIVAEDLAPKAEYSELVAKARDDKPDEVWKNKLKPNQYYVLRMAGTEPAFTSPLNGEKREGDYVCAGCGQELFPSGTKYNSGTGWPSFFDPTSEESVRVIREGGLFPRREVRCSSCDGHLGHVFPDGPRPTGLRYCMNGVAMDFKAKKEPTSKKEA